LRRLLKAIIGGVILAGLLAFPNTESRAADREFPVEIQKRRIKAFSNVVRVEEGDQVKLIWTTDEEVSLHLHGYNHELKLEPGEPGEMEFEAYATGRFPITSHGFGGHSHGHETLLYLEVLPR